MLKILQARLLQHMNHEPPDVQAGFRKVSGTRDQIANICWIIEKAREFQKNIYFCLFFLTFIFIYFNCRLITLQCCIGFAIHQPESNSCFLTCIQISQEAGQIVWYSHLFKNFPQFVVIHTVKLCDEHTILWLSQ